MLSSRFLLISLRLCYIPFKYRIDYFSQAFDIGDDSKLRLRRQTQEGHATVLPLTAAPASNATGSLKSNHGRHAQQQQHQKVLQRKRRTRRPSRRKILMRRCLQQCWSGCAAAMVSAGLSLTLLPFSWTQVDYHHQVQKAATHLIQKVEQDHRNALTALRGKHGAKIKTVTCHDGTVGWENDDFCDCPDGSDEPLTSACSHLNIQVPLFVCGSNRKAKSWRSKDRKGESTLGSSNQPITIYASRVNDGVRDCPDGSDEDGLTSQHQNHPHALQPPITFG